MSKRFELHIRAKDKNGEYQDFYKSVTTNDNSSSREMRQFESEIKLKGYKVTSRSATQIN